MTDYQKSKIAPLEGVSSSSMGDAYVDIIRRLETLQLYVDKTLHEVSGIAANLGLQVTRRYYPLDANWGLTHLSTGQPFFVNTEDRNITPWIIMGGHWETNVDRVLCAYARPATTIIDVGANMGYYTVKLGTIVGSSGALYAFEPNPEVACFCLENIKINGLFNNVALHEIALGDEPATAILTRSASNMASANLLGEQDADVSFEVQVRRLDDVLPADITIDLIKLDAEGYESKIIDGSVEALRRSPLAAIMIELGLERWERSASLGKLDEICGPNRRIYAVSPEGKVRLMAFEMIRDFLLTCAFHENYFLLAPPQLVEERIADLVEI